MATADGLGHESRFAFDGLNRLVETTDALMGHIHQQYNARNQLTAVEDQRGLVTEYHYNGFGDKIAQISPDTGETLYEYDKAGNLIYQHTAENDVTEYQYDALNRLTAINYPAANELNMTYEYDHASGSEWAIGRHQDGNVEETHFHYDHSDRLVSETDANGDVIREYLYAGARRIAMLDQYGQLLYIHNDHLGTPQWMSDKNGVTVWSAQRLPFGETAVSTSGHSDNPLRFPGQYEDSETGYAYNYFRDYDPSIGRYIQSDPIGLNGGINTFGYVASDPINGIDPFGLFTVNFGVNVTGILGDSSTNPGGVYEQGTYLQVNSNGVEVGIYVSKGDGIGADTDASVAFGFTPTDSNFTGISGSAGFDFGPGSINVKVNPNTGKLTGLDLGAGPGLGGSYTETKTDKEAAFKYNWPWRKKKGCP